QFGRAKVGRSIFRLVPPSRRGCFVIHSGLEVDVQHARRVTPCAIFTVFLADTFMSSLPALLNLLGAVILDRIYLFDPRRSLLENIVGVIFIYPLKFGHIKLSVLMNPNGIKRLWTIRSQVCVACANKVHPCKMSNLIDQGVSF